MRAGANRIGRRVLAAGMAGSLLSCSYGPKPDRRTDFVLFYPGNAESLDPAATAIVSRAAAAALAAPELGVTVAGFADAPTAPESNQIVSRIRAQTVANALVAHGVPQDRIHLVPRHALGADPGIESHRVDIRIGS